MKSIDTKYFVEDIFEYYRKAWCKHHNQPRRKPKEFGAYFEKQSSEVKEVLVTLTNLFNLFWVNVSPYRYFIVGLSLGIELERMHDPDVIERYKVIEYYRLKDNKELRENIKTSLIHLQQNPKDIVKLFLDHKVSLFILGMIERYGLANIATADTNNDKNVKFILQSYIEEDLENDMKLLNKTLCNSVTKVLRRIYE